MERYPNTKVCHCEPRLGLRRDRAIHPQQTCTLMTNHSGHIDLAALAPFIESYRSGDTAAGDRLCRVLLPVVRLDAARMLGDGSADVDDVVQESLVACLGYLRAEREFAGDVVRLSVTIARNRCRDLMRKHSRHPHVTIEPLESWLAEPSRSPLDELASHQLYQFVQEALSRLDDDCRQLLRSLYVEGRTPEQMRARSGLSSVHGIYYRRGACLGRLKNILQRRLRFGSGTNTSPGAAEDRQTGDSSR